MWENLTAFALLLRDNPIFVLVGAVVTLGAFLEYSFGVCRLLSNYLFAGRKTAVSVQNPQPAPPSLNRPSVAKMHCRLCAGSGKNHIGGEIIPGVCRLCRGRGYVNTDRVGQPDCPHCEGSGQNRIAGMHVGGTCTVCQGYGILPLE